MKKKYKILDLFCKAGGGQPRGIIEQDSRSWELIL